LRLSKVCIDVGKLSDSVSRGEHWGAIIPGAPHGVLGAPQEEIHCVRGFRFDSVDEVSRILRGINNNQHVEVVTHP
jgi:hypothetical protein